VAMEVYGSMERHWLLRKSMFAVESHWFFDSHWLIWKVSGCCRNNGCYGKLMAAILVNACGGKSMVAMLRHCFLWKFTGCLSDLCIFVYLCSISFLTDSKVKNACST
jgi:hypothetical protein